MSSLSQRPQTDQKANKKMTKLYRFTLITITVFITGLLLNNCAQNKHTINQVITDKQEYIPKISTKSFVLENGLKVIVHEDFSDPLVHVDVTYHVGSAREETGKSGFAHLFEHMMFQGSAHVGDDQHIKIISESGGTANGTTNRDRTNYFQTVPSNQLETVLWLEADRMGFFIEGVTQEQFEIQRATVKNEKQQNYDNRPYGLVWEYLPKALYPEGHPYSWLTIGDLEDLDRANVNDLKVFFKRWYTPNNAVLSIGGAVKFEDVKPLVKKYFGAIPAGIDIPKLKVSSVQLDTDRYISYRDKNIRFPAIIKAWPSVPAFHPDGPALHCLAEILGIGKNSYMYKNLVEKNLAINASSSSRSDELAGTFSLFVLPFPGQSLTKIESLVSESLKEFEENGVSEQELIDYKTRYESNFIRSLETVSGKVSTLAYHQTFANDHQNYQEQYKQHLAITPQDVIRVYERYIKNKPAVILSALATETDQPLKPDNITLRKTKIKPISNDGSTSVETNEQNTINVKQQHPKEKIVTKDTFDRSIRPTPPKAEPVLPPEYWRKTFTNNMELIASQSSELPSVTIRLSLPGGLSSDLINLEKFGLASLTANLMNTATKQSSEAEIAKRLERIGSNVSFTASTHRFVVYISSLTKHLDETLEIFKEKLFEPAFSEEDILTHKKRLVESAKSSLEDPSSVASLVFNRLSYGDQHVFGIPDNYVEKNIESINRHDILQRYEHFFTPTEAELVVVGDLPKQDVLEKLNFLSEWHKESAPTLSFPETPTPNNQTIYFVNKENAAQSEIIAGHMTDLPYDANGIFYQRNLMNFIFGGNFSSRINLNLREDKGITYNARSSYAGSEKPGPFRISTSVKANSTDVAIKEIQSEIQKIRQEGIDESELNFMKRAIGQSDALKYESNYRKTNILNSILRFDLHKDYEDKRQEILETMDRKSLHQLAKDHLDLNKMYFVIVGDKKIVLPQIEKLKLPIIELNTEGDTLE